MNALSYQFLMRVCAPQKLNLSPAHREFLVRRTPNDVIHLSVHVIKMNQIREMTTGPSELKITSVTSKALRKTKHGNIKATRHAWLHESCDKFTLHNHPFFKPLKRTDSSLCYWWTRLDYYIHSGLRMTNKYRDTEPGIWGPTCANYYKICLNILAAAWDRWCREAVWEYRGPGSAGWFWFWRLLGCQPTWWTRHSCCRGDEMRPGEDTTHEWWDLNCSAKNISSMFSTVQWKWLHFMFNRRRSTSWLLWG